MKNKIMVIDDDRSIRLYMQKALAVKGYEVALADRGAIGLQRLLAESFDLVFIDMNMPEISGQAICAALRNQAKTRDLPLVLMTAMFKTPQQKEDLKKAFGANAFLLKPFTVSDIFTLVEQLLGPQAGSPAAEPQAQPAGSTLDPTAAKARPQADKKPPSDAVEGSLLKVPLPLILHKLYTLKQTGLLHLQNESARKVIYIKNGYPVFARSNILGECLGRLLVKENIITQADCDQSVEKSKESGRLQGTVLIDMGLLTPQDLHKALKQQVTSKLLNAFAWSNGAFAFTPQTDLKKNLTTIELSPAALIYQGIKEFWNRERIVQYLQPFHKDYLSQSQNPHYLFQDIGLNPRGEEIFAECLGDLTLDDILKKHPLSKTEVEQTLAALLISGMVVNHTAPSVLDLEAQARRKAARPIDSELRKQIAQDYKQILQSDYFSALGVDHKCDSAGVRRAYYRLAKQYHPDRFLGRGLSDDMEAKVNEIFGHITQAYSVLSNPTTRADYCGKVEKGPKTKVDINQVIEAETAFQQGRALLKVRQYKEAATKLKICIELSPEEPEYLTSYAWALFKTSPENPSRQNQALEILLSSRELNPGLETTHLYLGYVYQAQNKDRQSEKSFEMAVQANPDCTEALRELRLMNLRREQAEPSKGLFHKLLNKDK